MVNFVFLAVQLSCFFFQSRNITFRSVLLLFFLTGTGAALAAAGLLRLWIIPLPVLLEMWFLRDQDLLLKQTVGQVLLLFSCDMVMIYAGQLSAAAVGVFIILFLLSQYFADRFSKSAWFKKQENHLKDRTVILAMMAVQFVQVLLFAVPSTGLMIFALMLTGQICLIALMQKDNMEYERQRVSRLERTFDLMLGYGLKLEAELENAESEDHDLKNVLLELRQHLQETEQRKLVEDSLRKLSVRHSGRPSRSFLLNSLVEISLSPDRGKNRTRMMIDADDSLFDSVETLFAFQDVLELVFSGNGLSSLLIRQSDSGLFLNASFEEPLPELDWDKAGELERFAAERGGYFRNAGKNLEFVFFREIPR